jgi:hypothetical protein
MRNKIGLFYLVTIIAFLLLISACSVYETTNISSVPESPSFATTISSDAFSSEIGKAKVDWVYYKNLADLVNDSDQIFIGSITDIDTPYYVKYTEIGLKMEGDTILLPCEITVQEIMKGNLVPGKKIIINQVIIYYKEDQLLKYDETHLFFIKGKPDEKVNSIRQYILEPPMVGYPRIVNNKISVYKGNNLLSEGQSVDEVKNLITNALINK